MIRLILSVAILATSLAGCDKESQSNVTFVKSDDAKMNAAIDKARASVKKFIAVVKSPKPGQTAIAVKVPFKIE